MEKNNRIQRRVRAPRRNESTNRLYVSKTNDANDVEKALSPKPKREKKRFANRCCYVIPDQKDFGQTIGTGSLFKPVIEQRDFGQRTGVSNPINPVVFTQTNDQFRSMLVEQYTSDFLIPNTLTPLKELKKGLFNNIPKVENNSQYTQNSDIQSRHFETSVGSQWQDVDDIEDIDKIIIHSDSPVLYEPLPRKIYISDVPRVKIIAEKFSKYTQNNLELRRLDEKVVCVEYDIHNESSKGDILKPVQRMRAFFSIKPVFDDDGGEKQEALPELSSEIKRKFDIDDEPIKLTEKEIEIIDGKIEENKSYLEGLRRILKRKQVINAKKNRTSLDLQSLYEMAKRERSPMNSDFSDANLLSKAELQEVKDLILQRCTSSVHGISRRRVKRKEKGSAIEVSIISESIVAELLRGDPKMNVFQ